MKKAMYSGVMATGLEILRISPWYQDMTMAIMGIQLCVHSPKSAYEPATFNPPAGLAATTNITMGVDAMKTKNRMSMNLGAVVLTSMLWCASVFAHSNKLESRRNVMA